MGFPGEEIVATALEKLSDGIIEKMDEDEERRDREFTYKLKELDFYKGNYDKDIRNIFDDWFNLLQEALLSKNSYLPDEQQKKHQKTLDIMLRPEKVVDLKIRTMKYGGTETGKALALYNRISINENSGQPKFAIVYAICYLLSTLKHEILGQDIEPLTMIQVLINDYDENKNMINESRCYVEEQRKIIFEED